MKVQEWVDCAQGGQWPMYSRKGGSLDVVCSSERKKSGSTLRPQHSALSVEDLRRKSDDVTTAPGQLDGSRRRPKTKWAPLEGRSWKADLAPSASRRRAWTKN
jgi:hypothetical protein